MSLCAHRSPGAMLLALAFALLAACGGSSGGSSGGGNGGGYGAGTAPAFTSMPAAATVLAGQSAAFSAAASGDPAPSLQWERSTGGSAWNAIAGATSSSYSFLAAKTDQGAQFRARASNAAGSSASSPATLTVDWAPEITRQPANQAVTSPAPASFAIDMNGHPAVSCQWQSSLDGATWTDVAGAQSPVFSTGATAASMDGMRFRCLCTNPIGTQASQAATLTVDAPAVALTVSLGAGTSGTPAGGGSYPLGATVPYAYTALPGFTGLQVLLDGSVAPASGTLTMNGSHALAVTASPLPRTVTFAAGSGGTLRGTLLQTVANGGSTSAVTALPDSGYTFVNWTGAGFATTAANPLTVSGVSQDLAITANFAPAAGAFVIFASAGPYGHISPSGSVPVSAGADQTFTITADPYYSIGDVRVDGVSVGAVGTYTFTGVAANHTILATFVY